MSTQYNVSVRGRRRRRERKTERKRSEREKWRNREREKEREKETERNIVLISQLTTHSCQHLKSFGCISTTDQCHKQNLSLLKHHDLLEKQICYHRYCIIQFVSTASSVGGGLYLQQHCIITKQRHPTQNTWCWVMKCSMARTFIRDCRSTQNPDVDMGSLNMNGVGGKW